MRGTEERCNLERSDGDGDWSERERLEGQSGNARVGLDLDRAPCIIDAAFLVISRLRFPM